MYLVFSILCGFFENSVCDNFSFCGVKVSEHILGTELSEEPMITPVPLVKYYSR